MENVASPIPTLSSYDFFLRTKSKIALGLCVTFTGFIVLLLVAVIGYLIYLGGTSISLGFFTREATGLASGDVGGMKAAIQGTLVLIFLASIVGIPFGMLAGVYLSEYSSDSMIAGPVRFVADVLAGVPSIVVGILGYELLVRPLGHYNGWAGAAALAFIMVPIIARTTEEMLRLVPQNYREAAIGLGATKAQTIRQVVLPAAKGSLITGIMLAIARVAGETAPLLFTALNNRNSPITFDGEFPFVHIAINYSFPSLTVQIFDMATRPSEDQNRLAYAGIIVLIGLIFVLNVAIRYFTARTRSK